MLNNTDYEVAMDRLGRVMDMIDIHTGGCYLCVGGVECERLEHLETMKRDEGGAVVAIAERR